MIEEHLAFAGDKISVMAERLVNQFVVYKPTPVFSLSLCNLQSGRYQSPPIVRPSDC